MRRTALSLVLLCGLFLSSNVYVPLSQAALIDIQPPIGLGIETEVTLVEDGEVAWVYASDYPYSKAEATLPSGAWAVAEWGYTQTIDNRWYVDPDGTIYSDAVMNLYGRNEVDLRPAAGLGYASAKGYFDDPWRLHLFSDYMVSPLDVQISLDGNEYADLIIGIWDPANWSGAGLYFNYLTGPVSATVQLAPSRDLDDFYYLWIRSNFDITDIDAGPSNEYFRKDFSATFEISVTEPVPEPATMLLLGSGLIGLVAFGRRRFLRKRSSRYHELLELVEFLGLDN